MKFDVSVLDPATNQVTLHQSVSYREARDLTIAAESKGQIAAATMLTRPHPSKTRFLLFTRSAR